MRRALGSITVPVLRLSAVSCMMPWFDGLASGYLQRPRGHPHKLLMVGITAAWTWAVHLPAAGLERTLAALHGSRREKVCVIRP